MQNEAMPREDWERTQKGQPLRKKIVIEKPEPEMPKVGNFVSLKDINIPRVIGFEYANRRNLRNDDGVIFVGYDVKIILRAEEEKRGPGRPPKEEVIAEPKPESIEGWMVEGEFKELFRFVRDRINISQIKW